MSTFQSFQTGLMAGQQQAKMRREDDARTKAADAFKSGNYDGASQSLMGVGLMDEANTYGQMGEAATKRKRTEAYAGALGGAADPKAGYQAVRGLAAKEGDIGTMQQIDQAIAGMDETQAKQFAAGMEFLGSTAMSMKNVPPEERGQVAMDILQKTPYANPQVLAQIQQAAADGRITDEELDNFAQQTISVAKRVEAQMEANKPYTLSPGQIRMQNGKEVARGAPKTPGNGIQLEFGEDGSIAGLSIGGTGPKGSEPSIVRGPGNQPVVSPGKQQLALNKDWKAIQDFEASNKLVTEEIDRALGVTNGGSTGAMAWMSEIPFIGNSTDAGRLKNLVGTIKANVGFDKLQSMRENSPTGGALGSITEKEIAFLQAVFGSLETSQREEDVRYNLNRIKTFLEGRGERLKAAFAQDYPDLAQFAGFGKQVTNEIKRLNSDPNKAVEEYNALPSGAFYIDPDTGKKKQKK